MKPYKALTILKILLLKVWRNFIDRCIEEALTDSISFRIFNSFSIKDRTPNHTTTSRFRSNLFNKSILAGLIKKAQ